MKTNKFISKRINILFSLATLSLLHSVSNAQLTVDANNNVGIGSTAYYMINSSPVLWNNGNANNIFVGNYAGSSSVTGSSNTFTGCVTGTSTTTGNLNSSFGYESLYYNTIGVGNSAFGYRALEVFVPTTSTNAYNSAFGWSALGSTTTGYFNTAIGQSAGYANTTGYENTFLGYHANSNGSTGLIDATSVGYNAVVTASNYIQLGDANVTRVYCSGANYITSDGRFKTNVVEDVKGLAFVKKLRPVTYNLDTRSLENYLMQNFSDSVKLSILNGDFSSSSAVVHSGFIAQEVEQAGKDAGFISSIVGTPSSSSDPYGLNYAEIVVPLVKAVQELSKTVDSLTMVTAKLDSTNRVLQSQIANCCNSSQGMKAINNNKVIGATMNEAISNAINDNTSVNTAGAMLMQNIPNPFNQQTSIQYNVPVISQNASIMVFDLQGTLLKTIQITNSGSGAITINGNELKPGMFIYTLVVDGKIIDTKRMILTQ